MNQELFGIALVAVFGATPSPNGRVWRWKSEEVRFTLVLVDLDPDMVDFACIAELDGRTIAMRAWKFATWEQASQALLDSAIGQCDGELSDLEAQAFSVAHR